MNLTRNIHSFQTLENLLSFGFSRVLAHLSAVVSILNLLIHLGYSSRCPDSRMMSRKPFERFVHYGAQGISQHWILDVIALKPLLKMTMNDCKRMPGLCKRGGYTEQFPLKLYSGRHYDSNFWIVSICCSTNLEEVMRNFMPPFWRGLASWFWFFKTILHWVASLPTSTS